MIDLFAVTRQKDLKIKTTLKSPNDQTHYVLSNAKFRRCDLYVEAALYFQINYVG